MPVWRYPTTGRTEITFSPSSSRTIRSTPWVEGCWGPMLMNMVSSRMSARVSPPSGVRASADIALHRPLVDGGDERALVLRADPAERVVLPQRVALPVVRHEDPAE